ncbi:MAG: sigma-70 family RNA polymerase sigma factor [Phycisphaerae bacterium]
MTGRQGDVSSSARAIAFEDASLVQRCRDGDLRGFEALVAKYQHRLYNALYRMTGRSDDAEELAQDAFLKALEKLDSFAGRSSFYTWLYRIAVNLTISRRRREGRIRFQPLTVGDDDFDRSQAAELSARKRQNGNPGPAAMAESAEAAGRLTDALERLDDEYRIVVVLRDIEGMDYAQIAEVLELPAGTVKSRLHRGRCMLREMLSDLA